MNEMFSIIVNWNSYILVYWGLWVIRVGIEGCSIIFMYFIEIGRKNGS